jgi:ADP-heptose:LPS heptosyltransferase
MDLVISVDTSVAHLAGAMGKPVWILLPWMQLDFRWPSDQDLTPWYPSARLFRQQADGRWESIVHRVEQALGALEAPQDLPSAA